MKIAICVPSNGHPKPQFIASINALDKDGLRYDCKYVFGKPVVQAREELTNWALSDPDVTHLLWIDDDMVFKSDALKRLLDAGDFPILGALCYSRHKPYPPTLMRLTRNALAPITQYPQGVMKVDATGAAFLLVKREVFEKGSLWTMWTPTDSDGYAEGESEGPVLGEDFSFCLCANRFGFPTHVDTRVAIDHLGDVAINADFARRNSPLTREPKASVIIPTFNQRPTLLQAAVASALEQTVLTEVIVVNDGGDALDLGNYESMVSRVHLPENLGIAAALNEGIHAMTTPWFAWLSSDDTMLPDKIERQLWLMNETRAWMSAHNYLVQNPEGKILYYRAMPPSWAFRDLDTQRRELHHRCGINGSTVMIHQSLLEGTRLPNGDYFDTSLRYGQDWEMWLRLGQQFPWLYIDDVLGTRTEGGNLTKMIEASELTDPIRLRRDEEDRIIQARYKP